MLIQNDKISVIFLCLQAKLLLFNVIKLCCSAHQRWSRGHKARGQCQGYKKNTRPRPKTAFPRTDPLEAKDRNARGQGPRKQAQVLSKIKKDLQKNVSGDLPKKRKKGPHKNLQKKALHKILTIQKILLYSSRGQANFRRLEASRPRPRTSKCVLEDKDLNIY